MQQNLKLILKYVTIILFILQALLKFFPTNKDK